MTEEIPDITKLLSYKELYEAAIDAAWGVWLKIPAAVAEQYGWDVANKIITKVAEKDGVYDAEWAKNTLKLASNSPGDAMKAMLFALGPFFTPGAEVKITEDTPKRAVGMINKCYQLEELKKNPPPWWRGNAQNFGMKDLCPAWWNSFARTINPKLRTSYNKMQCPPRNDGHCEFVCELEE
ncbi:MAG: hypothetical protein ACE5PO_05070 [Candidatus Bathyarchaeia archaeon]